VHLQRGSGKITYTWETLTQPQPQRQLVERTREGRKTANKSPRLAFKSHRRNQVMPSTAHF
jgi:hypothetical protein